MFVPNSNQIRRVLPYVFISLGLLVIFLILAKLPAQRVGDGMEYYALYYAWDTAHRPWMTSLAYDAYEKLYASHSISGMLPREWLENAFPALKLGTTSDFNHFWFYSFLAFICAKFFSFFGVHLQIQESFLCLHYVLIVITVSIAYKYFAWNGVIAALLIMFASPMLWFIDKVHTEFFTVCLVLSSTILIVSKRNLPAALFLALAATQNPSFAIIACIPLAYRVVVQRHEPYKIIDVIIITLTILLIILHPAYYFSRYGVVTPQFLAGGATLGGHLSSFYIWLIDPDLGLLPNWPLGVLALFVATFIWFSKKNRAIKFDQSWLIYFLLYLVINFYVQSSTTNLNSGATPGLARYALWYLPLAFPLFTRIHGSLPWHSKLAYLFVPVFLAVLVYSLRSNDPRRPENYLEPSATSLFIQSKLPWLYNPPSEVFMERYSGLGENSHNVLAVIGPACNKLLIIPGTNRNVVASRSNCLLDVHKLSAYANSIALTISSPQYVSLNEQDRHKLALELRPAVYKVGTGRDGNYILGQGWSDLENWGIWSQNKVAGLRIPCDNGQFFSSKDKFILSLKLQPFNKQNLTILGNANVLWQGEIDGQSKNISFDVPARNCIDGISNIEINISNPTSPYQLGQSLDKRKLGVGLLEFQIGGYNSLDSTLVR